MIDELKRRASPMRLAILAVTLSNAIEVYYLSSLGTDALVTFGMLLPLLLMFDAVGIGVGAGASSVYARLHFSPHCKPIVAVNSIVLAFGGTAGLALLLWFARVPLLFLLGLNEGASNAAVDYLSKAFIGSVFLVGNITACALLRAANHSRAAAVGMITGACITGLLAPLLIYGLLGLPTMGLSGAAMAQTTGAISTSFVLLLLSTKSFVGVPRLMQVLRSLPEVYCRVFRVAVPATLANAMVPIGAFFVIRLLSAHSDPYVAAYGIAMRIEALSLVAFYAYSSVAGPVFGEWALKQTPSQLIDQVQACRNLCLKRGLLITLILLPLPLTFPFWLTACYNTLPALTQYFWWVPISYGAYGWVMITNAAFNGIGKALHGLSVSFMRCLGVLVPLAWLLGESMGPTGIFIAIGLSNGLAAVLAYRLLSRTIQAGVIPALTLVSPNL